MADLPENIAGSSGAAGSSHEATQPWSYRVPSPPRMAVLAPPGLMSMGQSGQESGSDLIAPAAKDFPFLSQVLHSDIYPVATGEWEYETRRRAQQILPFLYLGPLTSARDKEFLTRESITLMLAVCSNMSAQVRLLDGSKIAGELGIHFDSVGVDGPNGVISAFPRAVELINGHLANMFHRHTSQQGATQEALQSNVEVGASSPGKVLVYCESGNDRSAGVVAAYLMAMFDVPAPQAIKVIQARRFCAAFDERMKQSLAAYADIAAATRDVTNARTTEDSGDRGAEGNLSLFGGAAGGSTGSKRHLEDGDELDMPLEHPSQQNPSGGRPGFAPFKD